MPLSCCSARISRNTCACTVTSSAVVGSSAISSARPAGQRHGDHYPLAHAAGQLKRIAVELAGRFGDAHALQQAARLRAGGGAAEPLVQLDRLGDLLADAQHRVQAGHRLLEDHARTRAPRSVRMTSCDSAARSRTRPSRPVKSTRPATIRPPAKSISRVMASAVTDLPEPELPDQGQRFAGRHGQVERMHHLHRPAVAGEGDGQSLHVEKRLLDRQDAYLLRPHSCRSRTGVASARRGRALEHDRF